MLKLKKFTPLQIIVHIGAWLPLIWLLWDYYTGNLTINPIQAATQRTGKYALILLVLSLAATPANTLFGFRQALKVRRALGLYAFMYAAVHLTIFAGLDYGLDWGLLQGAILEKRFVLVGLGAFLILLSLAVTSFKSSMKRMGKNWKHLHKLVYLAGGLVIVHYAWSIKGDVLRLQGDIWQPILFGLIVLFLLVMRIPIVRRWFGGLRQRLNRRGTVSRTQQRNAI
jgi:sulfoxide reductase heme-binding subunit YedZ